jgi:WD40 repeat protein
MMLGFMGSMVAMDQPTPRLRQTGPVALSGNDGQAYEGTITVQTSDGQNFTISKEIVKQIPTINGLMEDIGESAPIPLPLVSSKEFNWIIQTIEMANKISDEKYDSREFLVSINKLSFAELIYVINACQYLGLEDLEDKLFYFISSGLSGKPISFDSLQKMNDNVLKKLWETSSLYPELTKVKNILAEEAIVSPDGNNLVSYGNNLITVWNLNNLNERPQVLSHEKVRGVIISPDGNTLISWSGQERVFLSPSDVGTIKIWNLNKLDQKPLELNEYGLVDVVTDGVYLIAEKFNIRADDIDSIKVWRLDRLNEPSRSFPGILGEGFAIRQSSNGNELITWSFEKIKIVDLNTFASRDLDYMRANKVIISHDGSKMITKSYKDETIKIWDLNNLNTAPQSLDIQNVEGILVSNDGSKLIAWSQQEIKIWNLNNLNEKPQKITGIIRGAGISPDGNKLIYWSINSEKLYMITVWDINNRKVLSRFKYPDVSSVLMSRGTISSDGNRLISMIPAYGGMIDKITIWDLNDLNSLNIDQIRFLMWLQYRTNMAFLPPNLLQNLKNIYQSLPDTLKNIVRGKLPVVELLIAGVEFKNQLQQKPEQAQPQLPQQAPQEVQPEGQQAPQEVQPEGQQAPQQPSWWQRWLPLFIRRQWTAPN